MTVLPSRVVLALAVAITSLSALAHDDAWLDRQRAPHGGQLRMAGSLHYELVTRKDAVASRDSAVVVYVTDHAGTPVPTEGATGTAAIVAGGTRASAALVPDGGNRMKGVARYAHAPDMKVVVSITLSGGKPEEANFTPGARTADAHTGASHDAH